MLMKVNDDALKKCLDAYKALSQDEQSQFMQLIEDEKLKKLRNTPPNPKEIAEALADFKSLTLKVKSAWIENQIDTYKIVKKKSGWEYTHKDNHQKIEPVMGMHADAAEAMMKQVFELGILHWEFVFFWNNCCIDMGVWTLDITFKNRPKIHLKYDGDYPDKWDDFVKLVTENF